MLLVNPNTDGPAVREAFLINQRASGVGQSAEKSFLIHFAGDVPATLDPQLKVHAATGWCPTASNSGCSGCLSLQISPFLSVSLHPLGLLVCSLPFVLSLSASLPPKAP